MTASELSLLARRYYRTGPYLMLKSMHYRPYICPFEILIPHVKPGVTVLDVGCGSGLFLAMLAGTVSDFTGVGFDSSAPAIETAVRMAEEVRKSVPKARLQFLKRDAASPWPSGTFDVVSLIDVLHHVPPVFQKSVFERAAQILKPQGILLYKDMADTPFFCAAMNRLHDLVLARQWIHYVPIGCVEEWARECGLAVSHTEDQTRLWYHHELRVFRRAG